MNTSQVKPTCYKCGGAFTLGVNGILYEDYRPICDRCAGVERADNGFVLFEGWEGYYEKDTAK